MKIYRGITEVLDLGFEPEGTERKELMVEHTISFRFEWQTYIKLEKGDSITYNGKKFYLKEDYVPEINKQTNGFVYDLTFYDIMERMKDIKLKYNGETDFKLTTTGSQFLDVVVSSFSGITKGSFPEGFKEIHFENLSVFDALNLIAEAYNTEWWLNGSILNISKCEFGEPVLLRRDIELDEISVSPSSETMITRLYAKGSTRNIPRGYSQDNRLKLATGYVDLIPDLPESKIIEGVHIFEDIYPRQTTSIVEVIQGSAGDTPIFTIRGNNTFEITQNDVIAGQPLKIAFNTGNLAGREFELIIRGDNNFEIKYIQEGDLVIPNLTLKPEIGDEFFFFNFNAESVLPSLITQAENELLTVAQDYLDNLGSQLVYDCVTRSILCEENEIDLEVGQIVTIYSENIGTITSRVRGYTKELFNKYESTYQVGNYSSYSRLGQIEKETSKKADKEEIVEIKDNTEGIKNIVQNLDSKFLSKINPDTAQELITFLKGINVVGNADISGKTTSYELLVELLAQTYNLDVTNTATILNGILKGVFSSEEFNSGFLGSGFRLNKVNDRWTLELDDLVVRKTMQLFELIVQKIRYQGGQVLHSPAGGKITAITDGGYYWKCEHDSTDSFTTGAQVLCQNFKVGSEQQNPDGSTTLQGVSVKRYWRLVTAFGKGWFNLSKSDCEPGSSVPEVGDDVAVLGHRSDPDQQSAIMLVSAGTNSPYIAHYAGINSYTTEGKEVLREGNLAGIVDPDFGTLSGHGLYSSNAYLKGVLRVRSGKTVEEVIEERAGGLEDQIQEVRDKRVLRIEKVYTPGYDTYREGQQDYQATLGLRVYFDDEDVTSTLNINRFKWMRVSENTAGDPTWNELHANAGATIDITMADLAGDTSFIVQFYDITTDKTFTETF